MAKKQPGKAGKEIKKLRRMIAGIEVAILTTTASDGTLHSRPMATRAFDTDLWFLTRDDSPKAGEIRDSQQVNLAYADPDEGTYVSITGRAALVRDPDRVKALWKRGDRAWFPEGKKDPALSALRVEVEHASYWDTGSGVMVELPAFAPRAQTPPVFPPGQTVGGAQA